MSGIESLQFESDQISEKYNVKVDYGRAKEIVKIALEDYSSNKTGNFYNGIEQPEDQFIQLLRGKGESEESVMNALFLLTSMTFSGDTNVLFAGLLDEEKYDSNRWIFNPISVSQSDEEKVLTTVDNYVRPQGYQGNALIGWYHNCIELMKYGGSIRNFFESKDFDSLKIVDSLFVNPRAKRKEKEFWRFGPKLSILLIQWMDRYGLCPELKNADNIGIPVDFEICRFAIQTGIVDIDYEVSAHNLSYNILLPMFIKLCVETGWKPRAVSEALWTIGSKGCSNEKPAKKEKNSVCPVRNFCSGVYSKPRDNRGKFYSLDRMEKIMRYVPWES